MTDLDNALENNMNEELNKEFKPRLIKPTIVAASVEAATNSDTERTTRSMETQMRKIVEGLEADIADALAVQRTVSMRVADLTTALNAAKAAIATLE